MAWLQLEGAGKGGVPRFLPPCATVDGPRLMQQERLCKRCRSPLALDDSMVERLRVGIYGW